MISREHELRPSLVQMLLVAAWCGLVCGLVEGSGLLSFQHLGWLNWNVAKRQVAPDILWVSPTFDLLLFLGLALAIGGVVRLIPRLPSLEILLSALAFLTFFDWLGFSGRIRLYGVLFLALGLSAVFFRRIRGHVGLVLRFTRRTLPWVGALTLLTLIGVQGGRWLRERWAIAQLPEAALGAPNVLIIMIDTLRADHVGTYGYKRNTSPNLDRLARQGVVFENAIATSSWTLPSHASLLTGLYPFEHGAVRSTYRARYQNLPEALQQRGYRTGAISANFEYFSRRSGFNKVFLHFEDSFHSLPDMATRTFYARVFEVHVLLRLGHKGIGREKPATDVTRAAVRWLQQDPERPFLLFLNYFDAHYPYATQEPYRSRFSSRKSSHQHILHEFVVAAEKLSPEQLQSMIDAYDGALSLVDEQVGRLLTELEKRGVSNKTIVVATSDHGELFGERGLLFHRNGLYRQVIHVPLIIHRPSHVPGGVRVSTPVSIASLPVTIMELVGRDQAIFPSPSLVPLWKNPSAPTSWPHPMAELEKFDYRGYEPFPSYRGAMKSLFTHNWHYIRHEKLGDELYDWRNDPTEEHDVSKTPEGQKVVRELAAELSRRLGHDFGNLGQREESGQVPISAKK